MPSDMEHDVVSIREWLEKEDYLPKDFDDKMIKKFLHSCYGSLERTKKCIERFATTRATMPEVYTSRDPLSSKIQTAFSITAVTTYVSGLNEIIIYKVCDPNLERFNFYDILKSFSIQSDYWVQNVEIYPEKHIIIADIQYITLKIIPKLNIMLLRDYLLFLLEAFPVRVREIHVINCPSYYDKLYALVRPALPQDVRNIIKFHANLDTLYKLVEKKHLPVEYGGEGESYIEQQKRWVNCFEQNREVYLNDNYWKADLKKKPKNGVEKTMSGSFRKLSID